MAKILNKEEKEIKEIRKVIEEEREIERIDNILFRTIYYMIEVADECVYMIENLPLKGKSKKLLKRGMEAVKYMVGEILILEKRKVKINRELEEELLAVIRDSEHFKQDVTRYNEFLGRLQKVKLGSYKLKEEEERIFIEAEKSYKAAKGEERREHAISKIGLVVTREIIDSINELESYAKNIHNKVVLEKFEGLKEKIWELGRLAQYLEDTEMKELFVTEKEEYSLKIVLREAKKILKKLHNYLAGPQYKEAFGFGRV